jgi:hypothetical protein
MSTRRFLEVNPSQIKIVNGVPVMGPREVAPSDWVRRPLRQQMSLEHDFLAHSGVRLEEFFGGNLDQTARQYGARMSSAGPVTIRVLPADKDGVVNFEFHREYDLPCWRSPDSA